MVKANEIGHMEPDDAALDKIADPHFCEVVSMVLGTDLQGRGDAAGTEESVPIHPHGRTQARPPTAPILCRKNLTLGA
jgi:hypothetical protein